MARWNWAAASARVAADCPLLPAAIAVDQKERIGRGRRCFHYLGGICPLREGRGCGVGSAYRTARREGSPLAHLSNAPHYRTATRSRSKPWHSLSEDCLAAANQCEAAPAPLPLPHPPPRARNRSICEAATSPFSSATSA